MSASNARDTVPVVRAAAIPRNEPQRLAALRKLGLLDTPSEERFDRITELASLTLDMPIALLSLIDEDRQWFKAKVGLPTIETSRDIAFCSHAVLSNSRDPFIVEDALDDSRFADNPLVTGDPSIRFYAGQVVRDPAGLPVGTLCVIDHKPRRLDERQKRALAHIATLVEQEFERGQVLSLAEGLLSADRSKSLILDTLSEGLVLHDCDGRIVQWNLATERLLGLTADQLYGRTSLDERWQATHADGTPWPGELHPAVTTLRTGTPVVDAIMGVRYADDSRIWLRVNSKPVTDEHGEVSGVLVVFADVTEETETRKLAAEVEARFRSAFDDAPIGMALVDDRFTLLEVNDAFGNITGYTAEVVVGSRWTSLCHPDDVADSERAWASLQKQHLPFRVEQRLVRADGAVIRVSVHASSVIDEVAGGTRAIVQVMDVTEQHRFQSELAHMAAHDPLTGLANRRAFEVALSSHIARCARYGPDGALMMLDLDDFKRVNDTLGHNVGDQLIISAAQMLQQRLRTSDLVCRLGGDEFAILLTTGGPDQAQLVAQDIVEAIRTRTMTLNGRQIRMTASVGFAVFDGKDRTADEMLVNADLAMYDAKEAGRDRWAAYALDRYDGPRIKARLTWMNRIEEALDEDRFVLWAQPVVRLSDDVTTAYELLIRMKDGSDDLIPPATFLYIAERFGLINRIDRWVLAQAASILGQAHRAGRDISVSANLSGHSLADESLLVFIEQLIEAEGFPASRLVLEVTETAAIANIAAARSFVEHLRGLGCRFALDDFGAGFGSFYYLKHLPFDFVKFDGEFIRNCLESATDQAIIRSLVQLARDLGKETIAEHVESNAVQTYLRQQGVDYAQGYHLGRPGPVDAMIHPTEPRSTTSKDELSLDR